MESANVADECINNHVESDYEKVFQAVHGGENNISDLEKDCDEKVSSIQRANEVREAERCEAEKKLKENIISLLENKATEAQIQLEEINSKWENISKFNDCLDIYNACENQRVQYAEVIQCKNKIIETLKEELTKANQKFVDDQKIQRNGINLLFERIDEQVEIMRNAYRKHLALIEETADEERKIFLYRKQDEWSHLNSTLARRETEIFDDTFKTVDEYEKNISDMASQHSEKFRETKKELELELQSLHIKFEETKIACLLNEKKLEYNYLVVSKRHEELGQIKAKQRRRINRLRDTLMKIENKKLELSHLHAVEMKKLQKAISALKSNNQSFSEKIRKVERVNDNTFKKIWKLNEKRARLFLQKILNTDMRLHEQQLHVKWEQPNLTLLKVTDLPSVQFAQRHLPNFQSSNEEICELETKINEKIPIFESSVDIHLTKYILLNIKENIKFAISDKIDSLMENLLDEKRTLVGFDNILKVVNINTEEELDLLKKHFLPFIECVTCKKEKQKQKFPSISKYEKSLSENKRTGSGNSLLRKPVRCRRPFSAQTVTVVSEKKSFNVKNTCQNSEHTWSIKHFAVIEALSNFMKEKKLRETKKKKMEPLQRVPLSRVLSTKDMELYWHNFRSTFVQERISFWDVVHTCLSKYYLLLQDQVVYKTRVEMIEKQNSELKRILSDVSENINCENPR